MDPLLICLSINDVSAELDRRLIKHILYVDDLQIYVQVPFDDCNSEIEILE